MRTTVETIDQLDMCKRNYIRRQLRRDFLGLNKIQRQVSKTTPVSSAQFIHSAMSDSSRPHGPQHSRLGHLRPNNHREEVQSRPSADNWIKALLSKALPTRTRPSFSHHQSIPSRRLHKPLSLICQRAARRSKKHSLTVAKTKTILQKVNHDEKSRKLCPRERDKIKPQKNN